MKRCPVCGSTEVRRSHLHHSEGETHRFRSPYRCQRCGRRFWVLSRKARITIGALAAGALVLTAIVLTVHAVLTPSGSHAPNAAAAATTSAGAAVPEPALGASAPKP